MNSFIKNSFHLTAFGLAMLVFLVTAYFSVGYYHGDEHYQIIEFAGVKLGTNGFLDMAWEYKEQLRSSFQPIIAFVLIKFLQLLGITDPYSQLFIIRAITAFLALFSIRFFVNKTSHWFTHPTTQKSYYFLSYLLWFIPFLSVRFSSETWAVLLFLPAIGIMMSQEIKAKDYILIGLFSGLSFLCRYQMAIFLVISLLWLITVKRTQLISLFKVLGTFVGVILLGIVLDAWFYEEFTLPFINYFKAAFINSDSPNFGSSDWNFYLKSFLFSPALFIGICFVISFILLLFTKPKNLIVWLLLSFTIVHSLIPHKEVRFLFPIAFLFPFVFAFGFNSLMVFSKKYQPIRYVLLSLGVFFLLINTIGIVAMAVKPAGIGRMAISQYIHEHSKGEPIQLVYCNWSNPYDPWDGLPSKFYTESDVINTRIASPCELNDSILLPERKLYFVARNADLNRLECTQQIADLNFNLVKQSIPPWIMKLDELYSGLNNDVILNLYEVKN